MAEPVLPALFYSLCLHFNRQSGHRLKPGIDRFVADTVKRNQVMKTNRRIFFCHQRYSIVNPSCANSSVSIATSLPSALSSVDCTFTGHAFLTFQATTGSCVSFSREIMISRRSILFSFTVFHQS